MIRLLPFLGLLILPACAPFFPPPVEPQIAHVRTVALANSCTQTVRFHQGITAFDNVHREENEQELSQRLTAAVRKGLAERFQVLPVEVPPSYLPVMGHSLLNRTPTLPTVLGVDGVVVIKPLLVGTSEPAIGMQGFGITTYRLGLPSFAFANLAINLRDSKTTESLPGVTISDTQPIPGVKWKSQWADYTPSERQAIHDALQRIFDRAAVKIASHYARRSPHSTTPP